MWLGLRQDKTIELVSFTLILFCDFYWLIEIDDGYHGMLPMFFIKCPLPVVYFDQLLGACAPREGVIIDWPLKRLFNDARDVILTSRIDVMEVEDDDDERMLLEP